MSLEYWLARVVYLEKKHKYIYKKNPIMLTPKSDLFLQIINLAADVRDTGLACRASGSVDG